MTYRGQVKHGVVVLDGDPPLEEGTIVSVEPMEPGSQRGTAAAILKHAGIWESCKDEVEEQLAILRQMKQDELKAQLAEPEPEL
ncbi:MAG TPA: hypothetical protein VIL86_02620 [Tepidisphaeraceae bacterium]|jgi:hypothetical protein